MSADIGTQYPDISLLQCPLRRSQADITDMVAMSVQEVAVSGHCKNVNREGGAAKLAAQKAIGRSLPGFIRQGWRPNRSPARTVPDSMGDLGGQDGPKALQEASRRRTATRAKRYAHSGFRDKGAGSKGHRNIF